MSQRNTNNWKGIHELSIVIPLYNAENHVLHLVEMLTAALGGLELFEIVLVDDCSSDRTLKKLDDLKDYEWNIRVIQLRRNVGQATATAIGLAHSKYEYIVTLDDDLQHDPFQIPRLLHHLSESVLDFVVASFSNSKHGFFRRTASNAIHRIARVSLNTPSEFQFSSFIAFKRSFIESARLMEMAEVELGWMFRLSSRYQNYPVSHLQGLRESSTYRLPTLIRAARPYIRHLMTRATKPIATFGLLATLLATFLSAFYLVRFVLIGSSIPGFATLSILGLSNIGISSFFLSLTLSWLEKIRHLQLSNFASAIGSIVRLR